MHHRVTRTARARRRSGGQNRPSGAFLERGRVPDGAPKNALHESVRRFLLLYFKKAQSGAASEILEQGGGTQCRKERHKGDSSKCSGTVKTVPYGCGKVAVKF